MIRSASARAASKDGEASSALRVSGASPMTGVGRSCRLGTRAIRPRRDLRGEASAKGRARPAVRPGRNSLCPMDFHPPPPV